jgi:uncharacterized Rmd1/YagE family protein
MTATDTNLHTPVSKSAASNGSDDAIAVIKKAAFTARAIYVGEYIDLRHFVRSKRVIAQQPAITPVTGGGLAILYRYGAVVFFDASLTSQKTFLDELRPRIRQPYVNPETEEISITINSQAPETETNGTLILIDASVERLQIVAAVLSKSVALAQYEADVAVNFDRIEPFAIRLEQSGRGGRNMRLLLRHIGRALLDELKMVARIEVIDRPEVLWDHPDLEQLYRRLEDEFELQERAAILDRKIELISRTVETVLDLLQKRRSVRVEWYIVILIVIEIALTLYDLFWRST